MDTSHSESDGDGHGHGHGHGNGDGDGNGVPLSVEFTMKSLRLRPSDRANAGNKDTANSCNSHTECERRV